MTLCSGVAVAMQFAKPYPYVYVNADGSARELHAAERKYLETEFTGGDGAAPYIKQRYEQRNGWDEISGYLKRSALPDGTTIYPAPIRNPIAPMNREATIAWLRAKGLEVIVNPDGSLSTHGKPRPRTLH